MSKFNLFFWLNIVNEKEKAAEGTGRVSRVRIPRTALFLGPSPIPKKKEKGEGGGGRRDRNI
jgi:hypothetical protein